MMSTTLDNHTTTTCLDTHNILAHPPTASTLLQNCFTFINCIEILPTWELWQQSTRPNLKLGPLASLQR